MDNLTHTLTGVMLARAGLNRLAPRGLWIAAMAANIPDVDALSIVGGTETYFRYHRWITHALVFAPLMACVAVLFVAAIFRQRLPWVRAWLVAMVAIASHLLLDATNPYGIRLFLPFSPDWPALDATHVIDIWIWAILLLGLLWPMLSGLVSSEIGAKKNPGRGMAIVALMLLALYDSGRILLHQRAIETLQSRIYDGAAAAKDGGFPSECQPAAMGRLDRNGQSLATVERGSDARVRPGAGRKVLETGRDTMLEAARRIPVFGQLSRFAKTPYWRVLPADQPAGAERIELIDLRFRRSDRQGFTATAVFDANGHLLRSGFHF